ncbi:MAG: three-Cys-motif partner protein TcmP [Bacteroidales bacterium]|nr:three-Cys-motif partner protein TcmP [Bacteroidales bacterium]
MAKFDKTQNEGWGGPWTEQKLDCFESYVRAYLTIMNAYRDKYHWKLIYFDGFAGSGDRKQKEESENLAIDIFGEENVSPQDLNLYQGAAERVVRLEETMRGFDFYYFIDKYQENLDRLKLKLNAYETKNLMSFRCADANNQALLLAQALKEKSNLKALCLLDPFGMSIDWNTIERLAGKSLDLWVLVPTGSIVSRLIQNDGTLRYPDKLERFFGLPEEVLKERFYQTEMVQDLFGEHEETHKVANIIGEIASLYCEQLGNLFPYVTNKPLVMYNKNNVPIFHFVCASFNQTAVKIAKQIIDKKQR